MPEDQRDFEAPFAAAVDVDASASLVDRFIAWSGRDPNWTAG